MDRALGAIVRLQVQRASLKAAAPGGAAHPRQFEPSPLLPVEAVLLSERGVQGLIGDRQPGTVELDVHHLDHPRTRGRAHNTISIGFTAHYARMRGDFGEHLVDGVAGENILIGSDAVVPVARLARGLIVRTSEAGEIHLDNVLVAEPCVEFTRFALGMAADEPSGERVATGLGLLRGGRRGFYLSYRGPTAMVRVGDEVFAAL
ncbi:MAG: hypothetical protein M3336_03270 [Chloroflexota bacterium]|nr:hypothetical protein [Chloroflexota bacterium]